jgi:hypothetical protein
MNLFLQRFSAPIVLLRRTGVRRKHNGARPANAGECTVFRPQHRSLNVAWLNSKRWRNAPPALEVAKRLECAELAPAFLRVVCLGRSNRD